MSGAATAPRPKVNKKPHPKFAPRRNAALPLPRPPRAAKAPEEPKALSAGQHLLWTAGGALGASALGAVAARWGLAPDFLATAITVGAGAYAYKTDVATLRTLAAGAASAGGSQLLLLKFGPQLSSKPTTVVIANQNHAPPARPKNADMGALPPGMLHSAFERSRAELAIADQVHDPYSHFDQHHHAA